MPTQRAFATVTSKGQVTIPLAVRKRLGVGEGDRLEFVTENGVTVVRPWRGEDDPFERWAGALPAFSTVEEVNAWVAGMRDEDEFSGPALRGEPRGA